MRTPHLPRGLDLSRVPHLRLPRPHLPRLRGSGPARAIGVTALALAMAGTGVVVVHEDPAAAPQQLVAAPEEPMDLTGLFADTGTPPGPAPSTEAAPDAIITADSGAQAPAAITPPLTLAPLAKRTDPDIVVTKASSFSPAAVTQIAGLAKGGAALPFRSGQVSLLGRLVPTAGVNPGQFRQFAAKGTAEATAVWQAVARGEVVASHNAAKQLGLVLGDTLQLVPRGGGVTIPVRLGALATTGLPSTDLVVDEVLSDKLALPAESGIVLASREGSDPVKLANLVREITGEGAVVDLLSAPTSNPTAFLTGGEAAKAFGAFSYRYFADGTIAPDARWVQQNIRTEVVPIMGRVTCHRLMLVQLRGALAEVQARGLADKLRTYDGCYVPRFIERNPDRPISLHTWGIAIDMDAATNYRGIRGTMDMRVVEIFKRWGFRWGGDWKYTDSMHFEMGAILTGAPS